MIIRNLLIAGIGCCALGLATVLLWPTSSDVSDGVQTAAVDSTVAMTGQTAPQANPVLDKTVPDETDSQSETAPATATYDTVMDAAETLMQCTLDGSCVADDQSDPRAGHMQTVEKLSRTLDTLVESAQTDSAAPALKLGGFARRMLAFPDGHVQARAISLMGAMGPQPQNVDAIVTHLSGHHDASLFELGLAELGRYAGAQSAASTKIDGLLMQTLRSGGHFAAQTVATNVGKLIHPGNVDKFETLAGELPAQTRTAKLLKSTLAEYRTVASGG